jgi:hypothetical protein
MSAGFVLDKYKKVAGAERVLYMHGHGTERWVPGHEGLMAPGVSLVDRLPKDRYVGLVVPGGYTVPLNVEAREVGPNGPVIVLSKIPVVTMDVTLDGKKMVMLAVQRRAMEEGQFSKYVPSELLGFVEKGRVTGNTLFLKTSDGFFEDENGEQEFSLSDVHGPLRDDERLQWHMLVSRRDDRTMAGLFWNHSCILTLGTRWLRSSLLCVNLFEGVLDIASGEVRTLQDSLMAQTRRIVLDGRNLGLPARGGAGGMPAGAGMPACAGPAQGGAGMPACAGPAQGGAGMLVGAGPAQGGAGMPAGAGPAQGGAGGAGNLRRLFAADPAELVRAGLDPEEPVLHKHLLGFQQQTLTGWKKRAAKEHDQLCDEMRDVKRLLQAQKETSEAQTKRMDQLGVQLVDARKGTAEVKAENDKLKKELADQKAENERLKKMLGDHKQSYTVSHNINATRLTNIEAKLGIQRGAPDA